jgi:hypothetical protein
MGKAVLYSEQLVFSLNPTGREKQQPDTVGTQLLILIGDYLSRRAWYASRCRHRDGNLGFFFRGTPHSRQL